VDNKLLTIKVLCLAVSIFVCLVN